MIKPNFHRKEGPVAAVGGSLLGGLIGGGGTLAGLATAGGLIGSAVGGLIGGSLFGQPDIPSYPTAQAPAQPGATPLPGQVPTDQSQQSGNTSPATTTDIAKGQMDSMKRRGRLSTILTRQTAGGEETERLGG